MNEWEIVSKAFDVMADYCEIMGLEYDNKFRTEVGKAVDDRSFYNGARVACMNMATTLREFGKIIKG